MSALKNDSTLIFELIFMGLIGLLMCYLGWLIWKKERINLIHSHHYARVSEADKKPYTEKMGKALLIMGIGCFLTGMADFITRTHFGWIFFGLGFIIGAVLFVKAQHKYNGGIF